MKKRNVNVNACGLRNDAKDLRKNGDYVRRLNKNFIKYAGVGVSLLLVSCKTSSKVTEQSVSLETATDTLTAQSATHYLHIRADTCRESADSLLSGWRADSLVTSSGMRVYGLQGVRKSYAPVRMGNTQVMVDTGTVAATVERYQRTTARVGTLMQQRHSSPAATLVWPGALGAAVLCAVLLVWLCRHYVRHKPE